ncbi:sulfurtransferase TusA family protein [Sporosalibacterium faouarense]|uniref:sulfurtransferase TusA family protein n=1 Tax=Sporosalibacterium faouarense TaxID=516123 RepID=UPI00141C2E62|nr:sulfurtransferase TusA family protein [Sporosalibacterium faouarense]MTI47198.1 sulfurtransferase TusA family protein [Bacillota bacterium]
MKKVNCLGDLCPIPVIKTKKELQKMKSGESVMVVTDHSCTLEALVDLFKNYDVKFDYDEVINGVWEITITRL